MLLQRDTIITKREDQVLQRGDKHYKVGHDSRHISEICAVQYNNMYDFFYSMKWWFIRAVSVNGLWKDKRFQKITVFADSHAVIVTWYSFNFKFSKLTLIWVGSLEVRFEVRRGKITLSPKLVRIMLETWNLIRKYTHL